MAKDALAGKEIKETKALGNGLTMLIFTDGTFTVVSQISDNLDLSELGIEAGESSSDDDDDEEEEEDEDDDEESEEDEDDEDSEDEDEDEEDELTAEDLLAMDFDDLEDLVDDEELDIDVDDFDEDEDKLRKAIAKELDIKLPAKGKGKKGKK